jgi:syntaxin-binding protein 1
MVQEQVAAFQTISIDYYPRESRLVTFRDPWSFPVLFHPGCNHLVREHLTTLAHKVGRLLIVDLCHC